MSDMSDLKPCPFCGQKPQEGSLGKWAGGEITVSCDCNDLPIFTIEQWNTRPIEDELNATIKQQREVNVLYQGEVQRLQNQVEFYRNEGK